MTTDVYIVCGEEEVMEKALERNYLNSKQQELIEREEDLQLEEFLQKEKYEKPEIHEEETMIFPFESINETKFKYACRQCSSCHGCR